MDTRAPVEGTQGDIPLQPHHGKGEGDFAHNKSIVCGGACAMMCADPTWASMKRSRPHFQYIRGFACAILWPAFSTVTPCVTAAEQPLDWETHIKPILRDHCIKCHGPVKQKAELDLGTYHGLIRGSENGPVVEAGKGKASLLYQVLLKDAEVHMPPKKQVPAASIETIQRWIDATKVFPTSKTATLDAVAEQVETVSRKPMKLPASTHPDAAIDTFIEHRLDSLNITPTPLCDDLTFQRRLYLDLIGRPPTLEESERFLRSPLLDKRPREIDLLLKDEAFAIHYAELFDTMLMGRRGEPWEKRRGENGWHDYLQSVFAKNRPWDEVVMEMVLARGGKAPQRGAVWFLYERENNHQEMAEAVAPLVFGTQIKCAQCHDHPLAHEIRQGHYWGMVSAFNRSKNVKTQSGIGVSESAIGGFINFANLEKESQPATLTFLNGITIPEQRPATDVNEKDLPEYYLVAPPPEKGEAEAPAVPKFSRREALAKAVTEDNPLLAKAIANRVWALLMGRGLVHPVDEMNSNYPPSHPGLLEWLANDFQEHGHDLHRLIRIIAQSKAYQRSAWTGDGRPAEPDTFAWSIEKPLTAEGMFRSLLVACDLDLQQTGIEGNDLEALRQSFVRYFPEVLPMTYNASLQQAMFLSNSPLVDSLLDPHPGSTTQKLMSFPELDQRIEQAYLRVFGRWPEKHEADQMQGFLRKRHDTPVEGIKQMLWAMITSAEFLTNH